MLSKILTFSNQYGPNAINDQILFEFEIRLDKYKTNSQRTVLGSLDFLGYAGGIYAVFDGAVYKFAEFFSITFLFAALSSALYIEKKNSSTKKKLLKFKIKIVLKICIGSECKNEQ